MNYKIKIKSSTEFKPQKNSCLVLFLLSNTDDKFSLDRIKVELKLSIPEYLSAQFENSKSSSIKFYNNEEPILVIINKLKINNDFNNDYFRDYFSGLIKSFENDTIENINIILPEFEKIKEHFKSEENYIRSIVEGIYLGNYKFDKYLSEKSEKSKLNINLINKSSNLKREISIAENIMQGVYFARDLANEPGNGIYPESLAKAAKKTLEDKNTKVTIWDEKELAKKKMGAVLAVGKGSEHKPKFIIVHYKPTGKAKKKIALVGKGVTFDSGGISIKPSSGMGEMKADMSGAAAVLGTLLAVQKSKLPVEIIGVIPAVENMPSGNALKPGDIISVSSGKSIEVDNTDAEGRLILADALEYASKQNPDIIIDLATLTGACVVALGEYAAGLFTKDEDLGENLYQAGLNSYERVWKMPLWNDYNKLIKSEVADIKNLGGKWAGAITAAKFLEYFVDKEIAWAHIDIAGPTAANNLNNYTQKYMTGFGVRLLFNFIQDI